MVPTAVGPVQFGAPPETIKDTMEADLEVPRIFVLPAQWFSTRRGVSLASLEFPIYYSYFLGGTPATVVCDRQGEQRLRQILRESVLGPAVIEAVRDFASSVPVQARPDLLREMAFFRRKDGIGGKDFGLDDLVRFCRYDDTGAARLGKGVEIQRLTEGGWRVFHEGKPQAEVPELTEPEAPSLPEVRGDFEPPIFGLTVLGSSHGFDPSGKTTGFVLWVNRRGILVDPPMEATELLARAGVPPRQVDDVILTHCHADHDAGVFSKLLEEGRVSLYTTPTILGSFLRKYSALTGETQESLRRLFVFRPVTIGAPLRIQGAEFHFRYTLHSIPTIGFETYLRGKTFVYSSDTLYDPEVFERLRADGDISEERYEQLCAFPWDHSLVLHEAGVPPIHTPVAQLAALPESVKNHLRVIHIAEKDLPPESGLQLARAGFDNTIELPVPRSDHAEALDALDALTSIELFRDLPIEKAREFLTIAKRQTIPEGSQIIGQGDEGDRFYIILSGEAAAERDGEQLQRYGRGDFFGETALVTGAPRSANVSAVTRVAALAIDKYDFLAFLRGTRKVEAILRLAQNRSLPSWDLLDTNLVFRMMTDSQKTGLQSLLEAQIVSEGKTLWAGGGTEAWLLDSAEVTLSGGAQAVPLGRGAFLGDVDAVLATDGPGTNGYSAKVTRAGRAFRMPGRGLAAFLENNPRVLLALAGSRFVE